MEKPDYTHLDGAIIDAIRRNSSPYSNPDCQRESISLCRRWPAYTTGHVSLTMDRITSLIATNKIRSTYSTLCGFAIV